jgi:hypothetical protein
MGAVKLHPMPMTSYVLVLCCRKFCEILVPFWKRGCTVCWVAIINGWGYYISLKLR